MSILPVHRNFIIINQVIISTAFNFFLNMGIAWFLYRNMQQVPLWGSLSIGLDTLMTAFVLPCLSCYFITLSIRLAIKKGWIPVIAGYPATGIARALIRFPVALQGILHGVAGVLFLGLPVTGWFILSGNDYLSFNSFLWFKSAFAAILSLTVSPIMGVFALFPRRILR